MNIELLDSMGGDIDVVNAARVSMGKQTNELRDRDLGLIKYLADHGHWTPFAHVIIKTRITAPFFIARQWYRHEVGFARNETSRRYVDDEPQVWRPDTVRARPDGNVKQGSGGAHTNQEAVYDILSDSVTASVGEYQSLIDMGVAPEQARAVLPMAAYTQWIETASLYAYARLCRERLHHEAQQEIQEAAQQVDAICSSAAPYSWSTLMRRD